MGDCIICRGVDGDPELERVQVWADELWRLTTSLSDAEVLAGFSYLEPKRHITDVTALDGDEAITFGPTLARVTSALKEEAGCELVYIYVFGGSIPHLHLHLAPHKEGDAASEAIIRGDIEEEKLPSGLIRIVSSDFPFVPVADQQDLIARLSARLAG